MRHTKKKLVDRNLSTIDEDNEMISSGETILCNEANGSEYQNQLDDMDSSSTNLPSFDNIETPLEEPSPSGKKPKFKRFLDNIKRTQPEILTFQQLKEGIVAATKKGRDALNMAPIIILDFAGQKVFYSTHQSFLTHRGIYFIVINGSLNLDDEIETESYLPGKHGKPTTRGKFI